MNQKFLCPCTGISFVPKPKIEPGSFLLPSWGSDPATGRIYSASRRKYSNRCAAVLGQIIGLLLRCKSMSHHCSQMAIEGIRSYTALRSTILRRKSMHTKFTPLKARCSVLQCRYLPIAMLVSILTPRIHACQQSYPGDTCISRPTSLLNLQASLTAPLYRIEICQLARICMSELKIGSNTRLYA